MEFYNKGQKLLCVDGFASLKAGDYYTVKEVCDYFPIYTYIVEELPDEYWAHNRFVEVDNELTYNSFP